MLKKALPAAIATALLAGAAASAQAVEISGNVALTTDYKFRGISQSDESPAIQGGFDLGFDNGIYVGTWGSSVDFDSNDGFDGSLELDYYVGWAVPINDNIGIDVGYVYYDYPGDDGAEGDYQEIYGSLSLWDFSLGLAYSDDYYGETGNFMYYQAGYSLGLGMFTVDFHVGYNDLDEEGFLSDGATDYTDYSIGVSASWLAVDWSLAWVGTDLDDEEVFGTDWGDDTVVFTVSKSM
ncbi:TorF family putative porin [Haliea sp. E17]|uniref:TorF family putative porin n=1 Tax=Haliea sp. E17 TaxID=3401576 RepID=UPI003AAC1C73